MQFGFPIVRSNVSYAISRILAGERRSKIGNKLVGHMHQDVHMRISTAGIILNGPNRGKSNISSSYPDTDPIADAGKVVCRCF
jgi:hypothetical protein